MNEKYYNAIDSLIPPRSSIEKMKEAAVKAEKSRKVVKMKHRGKAALAAACLAVVTVFGFIVYPFVNKNTSDRGFLITAYAAEDKSFELGNEYVKFDTLRPTSWTVIEYDNGEISFETETNFNVSVEGKDIETITYSAANCSFLLEKGDNSFIEKSVPGKKNLDHGAESRGVYVKRFVYDEYKSYTVKPENQPLRAKDDNGNEFAQSPVLLLAKINSREDKKIKTDLKKFADDFNRDDEDERDFSDYDPGSEKAVYKKMFEDASVTVSVKYKDGTEKQSKIVFNTSYNNPFSFDVNAKIV